MAGRIPDGLVSMELETQQGELKIRQALSNVPEVEVVTLRVAATAPASLTWNDLAFRPEPGEPRRGVRVSPDGSEMTRWWRPALREGSTVEGPALIEEAEATTFLDRSETAQVLGDGTLEITWS